MFKLEKLVWTSNKRKVEKFGKGTHFHMERAAHGASEYQIRNNMLKHFQKVLNANEQDVEFSLKTNELLEIYIDGSTKKSTAVTSAVMHSSVLSLRSFSDAESIEKQHCSSA